MIFYKKTLSIYNKPRIMSLDTHNTFNKLTRHDLYQNGGYNGYLDIDTLKSYLIYSTRIETLQDCDIEYDNCKTPTSGSGQKINICDEFVFKGPPVDSVFHIERATSNCIQVDPYTMNILIQTVIKSMVDQKKIKDQDVEYYNTLCASDGKYQLKSKKAGWNVKNNDYLTVEDYLQNSDIIDVPLVCSWLRQIFDVLDTLYDKLQFHHCDPKAAQLLLMSHTGTGANKTATVTLGDLDKVTFTLNINGSPYRIKLTRSYKYGIKDVFQSPILAGLDMIHLLDTPTKMRFEDYPRTNCLYEKYCFLGSVCALAGGNFDIDISNEIASELRHYAYTKDTVDTGKVTREKIKKWETKNHIKWIGQRGKKVYTKHLKSLAIGTKFVKSLSTKPCTELNTSIEIKPTLGGHPSDI